MVSLKNVCIFELVNRNFDKLGHVPSLFHLVPRGFKKNIVLSTTTYCNTSLAELTQCFDRVCFFFISAVFPNPACHKNGTGVVFNRYFEQ